MGVVYRYIDLNDDKIKYVGIVWSGNRTLKQRVEEHFNNDSWCDKGHWRIEYVLREVNTRTDAEYLEAHYTNKILHPVVNIHHHPEIEYIQYQLHYMARLVEQPYL